MGEGRRNQASRPKSGKNRERQIPSSFGERVKVSARRALRGYAGGTPALPGAQTTHVSPLWKAIGWARRAQARLWRANI